MRRNSSSLPVALVLAFVPAFVLALVASGVAEAAATGSQQLAIHIQSNNADFNQTSGNSTYTGNVVLTRGGMTLTGSKLVITRVNDRGNIKAVLTGNPAHIDKKADSENDEAVTGHAATITYANGSSLLTLRGNAVLDRAGGDSITSPVITRNIDSGITHAEGSGGSERVHITIQPAKDGS